MLNKFRHAILYLLLLTLLLSAVSPCALAAEDAGGFDAALLDTGEEDTFNDSPAAPAEEDGTGFDTAFLDTGEEDGAAGSPAAPWDAEDGAGYEVTLMDVGEEDEFGDSPDAKMDGETSVSDAEIAGQSSDSIPDTGGMLNSMSAATEGGTEEGEQDSITGENGGDLSLEGDPESEASLFAGTSVSFSTPNLCISKGARTTISITVKNFSGSVGISGIVTNGSVCSASFGRVSGSTISLIVTGKNVGDCACEIYVTRNGARLATGRLEVSVLGAARSKLTVSRSSLNIAKNSRATVTVSHNQPGANVYVGWEWTNNGVVGCGWSGRWNSGGTSFPFYVDGKKSGSATIKLGLYNRFHQLLAYTYISPVRVSDASNPTLTLSTTSVQMYTGSSARIRVTVGGMSGSWDLNVNYPSVCTTEWRRVSSNVYDLYIGGNTPVSRTGRVELRDSNRNVLRSVTFSIRIISRASPRITVSRSSVSMAAGSRASVSVAYYDCTETAYLHVERSSDAFGVTWGDWSGNKIPCTVLGYSSYSPPVNARLTIQLRRKSDDRVLDTKTVSIHINAASRPPMAFGFENYDVHSLWGEAIPLSTCQIIFGNGQRAKTVFNRDYGNGGVCFGMSTTSALIYHNVGNLNLRNFTGSPRTIYNLSTNLRRRNPSNNTVHYNLRQIIEAMHVSQYSSRYSKTSGVSSVANKIVSELGRGRAVAVCIRGDYNGQRNCGHCVLAYGYSYPSSQELLVKIYDPNSTSMATLSFTRSSNSGNYTAWYFSNFEWGTGRPNASINCIALDSISYIWTNRGSWVLQLFAEGEPEPVQERLNLLATSEKSFELYAYTPGNSTGDETLVLKCEDGVTQFAAEEVTQAESWGILPDGTVEEQDLLFYLPVDYYTFVDLSPEDGAEAVLSDDKYSVTVTTDASKFDLYAADATKTVGATVSASAGDLYQVSIGSSVEGEPDSYSYSGEGTGEAVSVALQLGELTASGVANASVSVTTDEPARYYSIDASHTEGGTVVCADGESTDLAEGDSCLMRFVPDEGYQVYNVNLDGTDYGPLDAYTFTDIAGNHQIHVDFRRDLSACSAEFLSYDEDGKPLFRLTDSNGNALAEEDYTCSWLEGEDGSVVFMASGDSAYTGVLVSTADASRKSILSGSMDKAQVVHVRLSAAVPGSRVIGAVFDAKDRMVAVRTADAQGGTASLDFGSAALPSNCRVSLVWVDEVCKPICGKYVIESL